MICERSENNYAIDSIETEWVSERKAAHFRVGEVFGAISISLHLFHSINMQIRTRLNALL